MVCRHDMLTCDVDFMAKHSCDIVHLHERHTVISAILNLQQFFSSAIC